MHQQSHALPKFMIPQPKKLLFFITVDWFFCSHFLERAIAAKAAGYDVVVLTHVDKHRSPIEAAGLRLIPLNIDRRSLNPLRELRTLLQVWRVFKNEQPTLIHQIALKPILLGSLAAKLCGISRLINAVVGGGYVFSSKTLTAKLLRPAFRFALKTLLNPPGSCVVFENQDDCSSFVHAGYVRHDDAVLIRGAGVVPEKYIRADVHSAPPMVLFAARLLWDKGLGEFVAAARLVHAAGLAARFVVVGDLDAGNRASISAETLQQWRDEGDVEFWGFRTDMPFVLSKAAIACLPSYREGLPKALLEAMAAGLPCITSDVPGCREVVAHQENGLLVPPRDVPALASALIVLITNPTLRERMGQCGYARVQAEFATAHITQQTLTLYQRQQH